MLNRRKLLKMGTLGAGSLLTKNVFASSAPADGKKPLVLSTWDIGIAANQGAWKILRDGGRALDAVEAGVKVTEDSITCCVGLGAYPDRDGIVTLDSCIMDEHGNCGSVAFLERIKHPVSVARRVMEKTPHVMLAGSGAQQFAISEGFSLEKQELSESAKDAYEKWLKTSKYNPMITIEKATGQSAYVPGLLPDGTMNHDTIGMIAMGADGNLSGCVTTSGLAFKMRGRVGDSPIIGAGLYVDNEVGAACATGVGEEVIKVCGSHTVIEAMRFGMSPQDACKHAVERIVKRHTAESIKNVQVGFLAINKKGEYGGYAVQQNFSYAVCYADDFNALFYSDYYL